MVEDPLAFVKITKDFAHFNFMLTKLKFCYN